MSAPHAPGDFSKPKRHRFGDATISSAPTACAFSASACNVFDAAEEVWRLDHERRGLSSSEPTLPRLSRLRIELDQLPDRCRRAARKCYDFEILGMTRRAITFDRFVTRSAINTASASAVEPSYIEAFATSIPVNWQTSV
jgi:hypothetical protein